MNVTADIKNCGLAGFVVGKAAESGCEAHECGGAWRAITSCVPITVTSQQAVSPYSDADLKEQLNELSPHIESFRRVPANVRRFLGVLAMRINRVKKTNAVESNGSGTSILCSDIEGAFNMSPSTIVEMVGKLDSYSLGCQDEIYTIPH